MLKLVPPRPGKTPCWYVRGTHLGRAVDQSTRTAERRLAAKVLAQIRDRIERGVFARRGEPTFLSAAIGYMEAGGERRFLQPLIDHFSETPLAAIDQAAIDRAAQTLYPGAAPATRNRQVHTVISSVLKSAGLDGRLKRPKGAEGRRIVDWLWPEAAFRLFAAADAEDPEFGLLLRFLCYTGARLGEALALEIDMLRIDEAFAYARRTKSGDPRPIHLPPHLVEALRNHPRGLKRPGERLFRFTKGGVLYGFLRRAAARAELRLPERSAFHLLRHTWATWMRRYGGLDTYDLVKTGRWKDAASAARYEHTAPSEAAGRAVKLPVEPRRERAR